jgi:3-oxo-5alpha-steroid 4-dehydrogenase
MKTSEKSIRPILWDEEFDVVVVGFGAAGACAAIEARDNGARVLIMDRFDGGGASVRSGGVIYAGGGSAAQKNSGFRDSPGKMYEYLAYETGGKIHKKTLRTFCKTSLENLVWLQKLGVVFPESYFSKKTTQPPGGYGLYFSGNERQHSPKAVPRGHVPLSRGMSGAVLYRALKKGVLARGAEARYRCRSGRLIMGKGGSVLGIEAIKLPNSFYVRLVHTLLFYLGFMISGCVPLLRGYERKIGRVSRIRARGGVIICAGGFVFNRDMMREHAAGYRGCMPLGTPADDGSGIALGADAGGAVDSMNNCAASRFFCPPEAFVSGVLVNQEGERFCDESLYGATISRHISRQPRQHAYLIIDARLHEKAKEQMKQDERLRDSSLKQILSGEMNALIFRKAMAFVNLHLNRKKAPSIEALEEKCGMPRGSLARTVERYNQQAESGQIDDFKKAQPYVDSLSESPFYAVDCRLDNKVFPSPCFTLGGLRTDGLSGRVLRNDGASIQGLFAAGRSAAGVCARSYVSGLSLADCVFSGRRAGKNAAKAVRRKA